MHHTPGSRDWGTHWARPKTNAFPIIEFLLLLLLPLAPSLSVCLSVCPLPSQTGPGKYKQDALLSDRKSPLVCSLAPSPGPRPFPYSPLHSVSYPDPLHPNPVAQKRKPRVCLCDMCTCALRTVVCLIYCYPTLGLETWLWAGFVTTNHWPHLACN